ncbi:MAG: UvrD-helicase domain-containing protein [Pseudomonadales bacterium]|nr:UvrD-helicase domain-containing protein [Pseudomonadales bacterium]MCP5332897.1 UvrD-helicase domain-containing protein [Pseudomonadales bacterium]HMU89535.1 UvrD-helicase domain-containing protein [Pseudomonadales bacterium]HMW14681.1 UvrD-helicase domain-containing protein [Pseudomonadales bacterium]HMW82778.1 UvrD-helicase domain-containing protein [Pseudomonadales bacterium]
MQRLNPQQLAAVHYIDGPLLVLAGAGSGKTSVITRKIAYLVRECGLSPRHIAAVTFTNKAAREMQARIKQLLQREGGGLMVSTFHTLGLTIVRQECSQLGLRPGFSIFDEEESLTLIKEIMRRDDGAQDEQVALVRGLISSAKSGLQSPEQLRAMAATPLEALVAEVYRHYQESLQAYNAVDFDDLIRLPVELLRNDATARERWQNRIHYLLVDEYQDTNESQYQLIKLLVGSRAALSVVGDDDQSIYAWRGARPENLVELQRDFPTLKVIKLEQNYRSTGTILKAANTLISRNPHLFEKALWSELGPGEPIRVLRLPNEEAEVERIVHGIIERNLKQRVRYGDCAVLYRGNHQARLLELKLQSFRVPYRISGGTSFFARSEVRDLVAYLKLIVNPDDDSAFLRIINVPRREIGPATLRALAEYAGARQISLLAACGELGLQSALPARALEKLRQFQQLLERSRRQIFTRNSLTAIRELVDEIDYPQWLRQNSKSEITAERRIANVELLLGSIGRQLGDDEEERDIESAVARLLLLDLLEQRDEEEDDNRVQLMTLHSAKGLEFAHVYIMGMEEELLPHRNSIELGQIEEERRLAYVGITRARQSLTLTLTARRKRYQELFTTTPSRFLDELPAELLDWEGRSDEDPKAKQQRGAAALSSLRHLLEQ